MASFSVPSASPTTSIEQHVQFPFFWKLQDEEEQRIGYVELFGAPMTTSASQFAKSVVPRGAVVTPVSISDIKNSNSKKQESGFDASFTWKKLHRDGGRLVAQGGGGYVFLEDCFERVSDSTYRGVKTLMLDNSASLDDYDCYSRASLKVPAFRFDDD